MKTILQIHNTRKKLELKKIFSLIDHSGHNKTKKEKEIALTQQRNSPESEKAMEKENKSTHEAVLKFTHLHGPL